MNKRENNNFLTSFAIIIASAFIFSTNAQTATKAADELISKLHQKVLLNEKQINDIKPALNEYLVNPSKENQQALESKIESGLDDKQKMKYNIIKKDWWESISNELRTTEKKAETTE